MLQIKTIMLDFSEAEKFDADVNAALAGGWKLVRRDVIPGWEGETTVAYRKLYAELERETEPKDLSCVTCKHFSKSHKSEPCCSCEDQNDIPDKWEARE